MRLVGNLLSIRCKQDIRAVAPRRPWRIGCRGDVWASGTGGPAVCILCAMVAASVIGAVGVLRHQVVARIDAGEDSLARPSPLLFLLILAALVEHEASA